MSREIELSVYNQVSKQYEYNEGHKEQEKKWQRQLKENKPLTEPNIFEKTRVVIRKFIEKTISILYFRFRLK